MRAVLLLVAMAGVALGAAPPVALTPEQMKQREALIVLSRSYTALNKKGETAKALEAAQKALAASRDLHGDVTNVTASWMGGVARQLGDLDRGKEAARRWREQARVWDRLHGVGHWKAVDAQWSARNSETDTPARRKKLTEASRLERQAEQSKRAAKLEEAIRLRRQALAIYKEEVGERHPRYPSCLDALFVLHSSSGDHKAALPLARKALELRKELLGGRHPDYTDSLYHLALVQASLGNHAAALALHREALAVRGEVQGRRHFKYGMSLVNLGRLYQAAGQYRAAVRLLERGVGIIKDALGPKHPLYADCLNNLGTLNGDRGDYRAALAQFEEAARIRKAAVGENHPTYAKILLNLAQAHQKIGGHKAAMRLVEEGLGVLKATTSERHPDHAMALCNLAALHKEMGDHAAALRLFEKALPVFREGLGEGHAMYARCLGSLGEIRLHMGQHRAALSLYQKAAAVTKNRLGERHPEYGMALDRLAAVHYEMGDHKTTIALMRKAVTIYKASLGEGHPNHGVALSSLAGLLGALGSHEDALAMHEKAVAICKEALGEEHEGYARVVNNLALTLRSRGQHKEAIPLAEKALAIRKAALGEGHFLYADALANLAAMRGDSGDLKGAIQLYEKAMAVRGKTEGVRHPRYAMDLHNLGLVRAALGESEEALRLHEKALAIMWAQLRENAGVQSDRQQLAAADDVRGFLRGRLAVPDRDGHPTAASHALAWKGALLQRQRERRLFVRLAGGEETRAATEGLLSATRRMAALRRSPGATREAQEGLEKELEDAQAELMKRSAAFRESRGKEAVTPAALAAALPRGAVLVDYLFYHDRLAAFVHRPGKPAERVDLKARSDEIGRAIRLWRAALTEGKSGLAVGAKVKALVWTPLERHLEGAKVVLISPDGALGVVPFAALPGKEKGSYLVEDVALAVIPAPTAIPELMRPVPEKERHTPSLLAVGGVDYDRAARATGGTRGAPPGVPRAWEALPGAGVEVRSVAKTFAGRFKGGRLTELSGSDATTRAVRAALERARYAHLATHGFFAPEAVKSAAAHDGKGRREDATPTGWHPLLLSGLAFAGANREPGSGEEDGILTALEVSELDLTRLELSVLSACETGVGEVAGGEGVMGMQRAFQASGARSVIASLWRVDDRATQTLMADFYTIVWDAKNPIGRAEALRKAQLAMLFGKALDGKPRGVGKLPEKIEKGKGGRLPPYYWAAFVLSGDWR